MSNIQEDDSAQDFDFSRQSPPGRNQGLTDTFNSISPSLLIAGAGAAHGHGIIRHDNHNQTSLIINQLPSSTEAEAAASLLSHDMLSRDAHFGATPPFPGDISPDPYTSSPLIWSGPGSSRESATSTPEQEHADDQADDQADSSNNALPPKIGARFSIESIRILKQWLATHSDSPYPSNEDKETLQQMTGLTRTQLTNWLTNARRRGKVGGTQPLLIPSPRRDGPGRPGTPAPGRQGEHDEMNPMERWVESPPEDEPANVQDIARAISSARRSRRGKKSHLNQDSSFDDGSGQSLFDESSASSLGSSMDGSGTSASSHGSGKSVGVRKKIARRPQRRRRNVQNQQRTALSQSRGVFECTFCTDTFRTKHEWQRHEKTLHVPLERWTCSPNGAAAIEPESGLLCCVFCGEADPDEAHIERHNPDACQERNFNRRDHLKQHLRLVHDGPGVDWAVQSWKHPSPEIQSKCGFCGKSMQTWSERVDHLADHFKMGQTMANWTGDWGFDDAVTGTVENFIMPYVIDHERSTPVPFKADRMPIVSPRTAYELIAVELAHFMQKTFEKTNRMPTNAAMHLEACRIVFASEVIAPPETRGASAQSWLREIITSDEKINQKAKFTPIRSQEESGLARLQINGKKTLFEDCTLERQLQEFIRTAITGAATQGQTQMQIPPDSALQSEASRIINRMEFSVETTPCDFVANWLIQLVTSSTHWIPNVRRRAEMAVESSAHATMPARSEEDEYPDLAGQALVDLLTPPLPTQSGICISSLPIYGLRGSEQAFDGIQKQQLLHQHQQRQQQQQGLQNATSGGFNVINDTYHDTDGGLGFYDEPPDLPLMSMPASPNAPPAAQLAALAGPTGLEMPSAETWTAQQPPVWTQTGGFIFTGSNYHRWLLSGLKRFVAATTSPNNPNQHIPSDEELQHQARWLIFNEDDPWNQTAADNPQWLASFKREVGIL